MPDKKRVIVWDIETSLSVVSTFTLHPEHINIENIISDMFIICGSWKVLGEKQVHTVSVLDNKNKDLRNDRYVVEKLAEVVKGADMIVAHNGDKFDLKKLNARIIYYNLPPLPAPITVDTLKETKKVASFISHKLGYLGPHLGLGQKIKNSPGLWVRILQGDTAAVKDMLPYNRHDVELVEKYYLRTRKYYHNTPNLAPTGMLACPTCESRHVQARGYSITKAGLRYHRYQCQSCGFWFKDGHAVDKPEAKPLGE